MKNYSLLGNDAPSLQIKKNFCLDLQPVQNPTNFLHTTQKLVTMSLGTGQPVSKIVFNKYDTDKTGMSSQQFPSALFSLM
jgi:hypothetical protein